MTTASIHKELDTIEHIPSFYSSAKLGLAAALACSAFTFLLGGGVIEMLLVFIAAGIGNYIRTKMIHRHFTLLLNISVSISVACLIYALCLKFAQVMFNVSSVHEPGYICSILSQVFHLSQVELTLQSLIFVLELKDLHIQA